jgi:hypothetical protein
MCFVRGPLLSPTPTASRVQTRKAFIKWSKQASAYRHVAVQLCKTTSRWKFDRRNHIQRDGDCFRRLQPLIRPRVWPRFNGRARPCGLFQALGVVNEWKSRRRCRQAEVVNTLIPPVASERLLVDLRRVAFFFLCVFGAIASGIFTRKIILSASRPALFLCVAIREFRHALSWRRPLGRALACR